MPKNKLTVLEEQQVLSVLHSPEFIDQAPAEVYATLLERGQCLCSIASMYRTLGCHNEIYDRHRQTRHPSRAMVCRPPTAKPGTSLHEQGLAVDFTTDTPGYTWLKANSRAYGLILLVGGFERWRFSTTGH